MQKLDDRLSPHPTQAPAAAVVPFARLPLRPPASLTKLLLVDLRDGTGIDDHPEIAPLLEQGWTIRSATPRLVESKGMRLLVVMGQAHRTAPLTRIK